MDINQVENVLEQYRENGGNMNALIQAFQNFVATDTTPHIGLNQWRLSDKPNMEDFNRDNEILDREIGGLKGMTGQLEESGEWSPQLTGSSGDPIFSGGTVSGYYQRIGKLVFIHCYFDGIVFSQRGEDRIEIKGLPFQPKPGLSSSFSKAYVTGVSNTGLTDVYVGIVPGFICARLYATYSNGGSINNNWLHWQRVSLNTPVSISFTATYIAR